jgi:hypothetical protein
MVASCRRFVSTSVSAIYKRMSQKNRARHANTPAVSAKFEAGVFQFSTSALPTPDRTFLANWTSVTRSANWTEVKFGAEIDGHLEAALVVMLSNTAFELAFYRSVTGLVSTMESAGHAPTAPGPPAATAERGKQARIWASWAPIAFADDLTSIFFYRISPHVMRRARDNPSKYSKPEAVGELVVPEFEVLLPAPTLLGFLKSVRDEFYDGKKYEDKAEQ